MNISEPFSLDQLDEFVSYETKQQLCEVLNSLYGHQKTVSNTVNIKALHLNHCLKEIINKLNTIVENLKVSDVPETEVVRKGQIHWCKVLWISESIASFLFQPDFDAFYIDTIDSKSAIAAYKNQTIPYDEYQMILIDESIVHQSPFYLHLLAKSALIIQVVGAVNHQSTPYPTISYQNLMDDYADKLSQIWKKHIVGRTIQKVKKTERLHVLSIEDDQDSQMILKQLLQLNTFIDVKTCSNLKEAHQFLLEQKLRIVGKVVF